MLEGKTRVCDSVTAPVATVCFWIWRVTEKFSQPGKLSKEGKKSQKITQTGSGSRRVNKICCHRFFNFVNFAFYCYNSRYCSSLCTCFSFTLFYFYGYAIAYSMCRWINKSLLKKNPKNLRWRKTTRSLNQRNITVSSPRLPVCSLLLPMSPVHGATLCHPASYAVWRCAHLAAATWAGEGGALWFCFHKSRI